MLRPAAAHPCIGHLSRLRRPAASTSSSTAQLRRTRTEEGGAFILAGDALLEAVDWILYLFGAFLLFTAFRMFRHSEMTLDPQQNRVLRLVGRFIPMSSEYDGQRLFTRRNGVLMATPLFAVLVMIETTDLVFAVDSIPAIFAVTRDPFGAR